MCTPPPKLCLGRPQTTRRSQMEKRRQCASCYRGTSLIRNSASLGPSRVEQWSFDIRTRPVTIEVFMGYLSRLAMRVEHWSFVSPEAVGFEGGQNGGEGGRAGTCDQGAEALTRVYTWSTDSAWSTRVDSASDMFSGKGVRIHPENARMSGRHGVQYVARCVACAALTLVVRQ